MVVILASLSVGAAEEPGIWPNVSIGEYKGYAESYVVGNGNYIIEGDTNLGVECAFSVSVKGVTFNGQFFHWNAPGVQASREAEKGRQRVNFRGKIGNVIVADISIEDSKGEVIRVIRMSVALAPNGRQAP